MKSIRSVELEQRRAEPAMVAVIVKMKQVVD